MLGPEDTRLVSLGHSRTFGRTIALGPKDTYKAYYFCDMFVSLGPTLGFCVGLVWSSIRLGVGLGLGISVRVRVVLELGLG